jgi:hypothetical protein
LRDAHIRSVKLTSSGKNLLVAGETNEIAVWDMGVC